MIVALQFLAFLGRCALAGLIERVVLTGRRATGDNMDGVNGLQASHDFMIVLDEEAPDDVLTGMPGYPAFLQELHSAAREANVVAMNVMLCRRSYWVDLNGSNEVLNLMRRGPIVAARL